MATIPPIPAGFAPENPEAFGLDDDAAPAKVTQYGYPDDETPDRLTERGIGMANNPLTPSVVALSPSEERRHNAQPGDVFEVTDAAGNVHYGYFGDRTSQDLPDDRIDFYQPQGLDKSLSDVQNVRNLGGGRPGLSGAALAQLGEDNVRQHQGALSPVDINPDAMFDPSNLPPIPTGFTLQTPLPATAPTSPAPASAAPAMPPIPEGFTLMTPPPGNMVMNSAADAGSRPDDPDASWLQDKASRFVEGATTMPIQSAEGLARSLGQAERRAGLSDGAAINLGLADQLAAQRGTVTAKMEGSQDRSRDPDFSSALFSGVGQAGSGLVTAALTGLPGAFAAGAGQMYQQAYDEAYSAYLAKGLDPATAAAQANTAGLANMPAAAFDAVADRFLLGGSKALRALAPSVKIGRVAEAMAKTAVLSGSQGAQRVESNVVAQNSYDPDRPLSDGVGTAMAVGALLAAPVAGLHAALARPEGAPGSAPAPTTPESRATLLAQQAELTAGKRDAMMFPTGSAELPLPEGMARVETPAGVFHFDPDAVDAKQVQLAVSTNTIGDLLDYGISDKPAPDVPQTAVVRRDPQGNEIEAVVTDQAHLPAVLAKQGERAEPGQSVATEAPAKVIADREAAARGAQPAPAEAIAPRREATPAPAATPAPIEDGALTAEQLQEQERTRARDIVAGQGRFRLSPTPGAAPMDLQPRFFHALATKMAGIVKTPVEVVERPQDLPETTTGRAARAAIEGGTSLDGFHDPETGKVVLYLPGLAKHENPYQRAGEVVFHEAVGHEGLPAIYGGRENVGYGRTMDAVWSYFQREGRGDALARKGGFADFQAMVRAYAHDGPGLVDDHGGLTEEGRRFIAEELVARSAEDYLRLLPEERPHWVERLRDDIAHWFRRVLGRELTGRELHTILRQAMEQVRTRREDQNLRNGASSRFAKGAPDSPEFQRWFAGSKVVDAEGKPLVVYHGTDTDFSHFDPAARGGNTRAGSARKAFFFASDPDVSASYVHAIEEHEQGEGATDAHYEVWDLRQDAKRKLVAQGVDPNDADHILNQEQDRFDQGLPVALSDSHISGFDGETRAAIHAYEREQAKWRLEYNAPYRQGARTLPVYLRLINPLIHDFKGEYYRERTYSDLLDLAKKEGRDGVIFKNTWDGGIRHEQGDKRLIVGDVYAAFHPEQIKSATGNRGTYNPANPDIRMAKGPGTDADGFPEAEPPKPPQEEAWTPARAQTRLNQIDVELARREAQAAAQLRELEKNGINPHAPASEGWAETQRRAYVEASNAVFDLRDERAKLGRELSAYTNDPARRTDDAAGQPATVDEVGSVHPWHLTKAFLGTADVFDRTPGLKFLGKAIRQHVDTARRYQGELLAPFRAWDRPLNRKVKRQAYREFESYWGKTDARKAPAEDVYAAASPEGKRLIDLTKAALAKTGNINQKNKLVVWDPNLGGGKGAFRAVGRVGDYFPRTLRQDVWQALQAPNKYPEKFAEVVHQLKASGFLQSDSPDAMRAEALAKINGVYASDFSTDHFGNIEAARVLKLPSSLYDYSFSGARRYLMRWSERMAQIESYGQKVRGEGFDLFDLALEKLDRATLDGTVDRTKAEQTARYINAVRDRAYGLQHKGPVWEAAALLNAAATGLHLGNPATAMVNLLSGVGYNFTFLGRHAAAGLVGMTREAAHGVAEMRSLRGAFNQIHDAMERGIIQDDLMQMAHDAGEVRTRALDRTQEGANFLLKWSGFNAGEYFVRAHALASAKSFLRSALRSWDANPEGAAARQYRGWMERNHVDPDALAAEGGNGPRTDAFLRNAVNGIQGGYRFDQVPAWSDSPAGRFFFKYQKWGTMMLRNVAINVLRPAVEAAGQLRRGDVALAARNLVPLVSFAVTAGLIGYSQDQMREMVFGTPDQTASFEEIAKTLDADTARGLALLVDKYFTHIINAGALGILGNYAQIVRDVTQRSRFKSPLSPPALGVLTPFGELAMRLWEQHTLSAKDFKDFLRSETSQYRTVVAAGSRALGAFSPEFREHSEELRRQDLAWMRTVTARFADEIDAKQSKTTIERVGKNPMSPYLDRVNQSLLVGDKEAATAAVHDYLENFPKADQIDALRRLSESVAARRPIRVGASNSDASAQLFLKWAETRLAPADVERLKDIDQDYRQTAVSLGLLKRERNATDGNLAKTLKKMSLQDDMHHHMMMKALDGR